ncbi:MAG: nitroreductase family protein [Bacteroidota bacterium]
MNFLELAKTRQSVRKYTTQPVEPEKINRCVEAARLAPSACNSQPWKFIIVDQTQLKNAIAKETYNAVVTFNKFVKDAPVIAIIVMEKPTLVSQIGGRIKDKDFYLIDIGIAAEHFCLQAAEEGLGTCMLGWFNEKKIAELLHLPKSKRIGLLITLGYSDATVRDKIRKPTQEILNYNRYE